METGEAREARGERERGRGKEEESEGEEGEGEMRWWAAREAERRGFRG